MNIDKLRKTIKRKMELEINDDYAMEECWGIEINILEENVSETIEFLKVCTEEEFYELAETFPDVIKKTQSRELFQTMVERNQSLENEEYKMSNLVDLKYAEEAFL